MSEIGIPSFIAPVRRSSSYAAITSAAPTEDPAFDVALRLAPGSAGRVGRTVFKVSRGQFADTSVRGL